jgi:hypothetical protein
MACQRSHVHGHVHGHGHTHVRLGAQAPGAYSKHQQVTA